MLFFGLDVSNRIPKGLKTDKVCWITMRYVLPGKGKDLRGRILAVVTSEPKQGGT